ncbi:MAG: tetratricopeptide repeat protein [Anaerolineales bacterium]
MNKPFRAYKGAEPYVFVCYAHADAEKVYADMIQVRKEGVNLWYDEGIAAGSSWRGEIAAAIKGASKFLFFISKESLVSSHCLREIDYALNHDIEILPVYLDDSSLPGELDLVLNRVQALFREKDSAYIEHLVGGLKTDAALAPLYRKTKKRQLRIDLPIVALSLLLLFAWFQWGSIFVDGKGTPASTAAPNAYDAYLEGQALMDRWDKADNLNTAIGLFRKACQLDPDFALAFARLAEALRIRYALSGDKALLDEAVTSVDTAVRLNPNLSPVQVALGNIQFARGNFDLALAALERALEIDPNDEAANLAIAKLYARLGRVQDAETSFKKAVALNPENTTILNSYANFLYEEGRFDEAASKWQMLIRLAPEHYAALLNLGSLFEETGKLPEAITMYQRSIEIRPTYMGYSNLGTAYSHSERYPDAVKAYQQALKIDDSDWLAWGNLAFVYSWMNGMDQKATETFEHAIQLAEAARQQNPRDAFNQSDLALYYAKTEQTELALQRLETSITLAPESGEILAAAAEVYEIMGQRDEAVEFVQKALALGLSRKQLLRNPDLTALLTDPRVQPQPE